MDLVGGVGKERAGVCNESVGGDNADDAGEDCVLVRRRDGIV